MQCLGSLDSPSALGDRFRHAIENMLLRENCCLGLSVTWVENLFVWSS